MFNVHTMVYTKNLGTSHCIGMLNTRPKAHWLNQRQSGWSGENCTTVNFVLLGLRSSQ